MRARRRCAHCMKQWSMRARRRCNILYPKVSSLYETVTIHEGRRRCGDLFGATVIQTGSMSSTQTGPRYQNLYAADLFFPNRHAHLSLYQVLSRQSMGILCSVYISYSRNNYYHSVIICDIYIQSLFISLHFPYLILCINNYAYHVFL